MPPGTTSAEVDAAYAAEVAKNLKDGIRHVVTLGNDVLEPLVAAMFAGGHILIEGIPGTGKTLLARTLARLAGLEFNRIQFTNDLMPSDIVGTSVWMQRREEFVFVPGPLFCNLVLADEINRTSPRTLSCLLEAMERGRVSVDGGSRELGRPFTVLATRNPVEFHGTFPLPEAALDRFLACVRFGYPGTGEELQLYLGSDPEEKLDRLQPVTGAAGLEAVMELVSRVEVSEPVARYALDVVQATRTEDALSLGASPRCALSWLRAARARACIQGRDYVLPDDLKALAPATLAHRLVARGGAGAGEVLASILDRTAPPL